MQPQRRERQAHRAFCRFRDQGDPAEITRVFDLVAPRLLALAAHFSRDRSQVDDLVQATFLDAIENQDRFDEARPLVPWLTGILVHHARHAHRRASRTLDPSRAPLDWFRETETRVPDDEAAAREFAEQVAESLRRLPARYREVVALRLLDGFGPAEIADRLGRPRETVKTQLSRGLERLRAQLPHGAAPALAVLWGPEESAITGTRASITEAANESLQRVARRPLAATGSGMSGSWVGASLIAAVLTVGAAVFVWTDSDTGSGAPLERLAESSTGETGDRAVGPLPAADNERLDPTTDRTPVAERPSDEDSAGLTVQLRIGDEARPAAGVAIRAWPLGDDDHRSEVRAITGPDGVAVFARDAMESQVPDTTNTAWQVRSVHGEPVTTVSAGESTATVSVPAGIRISGQLLTEDREPLADALLFAALAHEPVERGGIVGKTDAQGRFTITDLPPGAVLGAHTPGHVAPSLLQLGDTDRADVVLLARGPSTPIEGRVVDAATKAPIASAVVLIGVSTGISRDRDCAPARRISAQDGRFQCDELARGEGLIYARAPGYATTRVHATTDQDGKQIHAVVALTPGASLSGRVFRAGNPSEPVAGARVRLRHGTIQAGPHPAAARIAPEWTQPSTRTDAEGRFRLEHVTPGEITVLVDAGDGTEGRVTELLPDLGHTEVRVALAAPVPLRAQLRDEEGNPLAGWIAELRRAGPEPGTAKVVRSDANGRLDFESSESGTPYRITVHQPNALPGMSGDRFERLADGSVHELVIEPARIADCFVKLRVLDRGKPATDAMVFVNYVRSNISEMLVARAPAPTGGPPGDYLVGPLLAGHTEIVVRAGVSFRQLPAIDLASGETRDLGAIAFVEPATLAVSVARADGRPHHRDAPTVTWLGDGEAQTLLPMSLPIHLTPNGRGLIRLQPGTWRISYLGEGGVLRPRDVTLVSGARTTEALQLSGGFERHLVYASVPAEDRSLFFEIHDAATGERLVRSLYFVGPVDQRGLAPILPAGDYRCVLRALTGDHTETAFTVGPGVDADSSVRLPLPKLGAR